MKAMSERTKMSKIQVVWFDELDLWDYKSNVFNDDLFSISKYPLVKMADFFDTQ